MARASFQQLPHGAHPMRGLPPAYLLRETAREHPAQAVTPRFCLTGRHALALASFSNRSPPVTPTPHPSLVPCCLGCAAHWLWCPNLLRAPTPS